MSNIDAKYQDVLVVEEVAAMCRCSVDTIRRISHDDLPKHAGLGKQNLYLREEVMAYIKSLGPKNFNPASIPFNRQSVGTNKTKAQNGPRFNAKAARAKLKGIKNG